MPDINYLILFELRIVDAPRLPNFQQSDNEPSMAGKALRISDWCLCIYRYFDI